MWLKAIFYCLLDYMCDNFRRVGVMVRSISFYAEVIFKIIAFLSILITPFLFYMVKRNCITEYYDCVKTVECMVSAFAIAIFCSVRILRNWFNSEDSQAVEDIEIEEMATSISERSRKTTAIPHSADNDDMSTSTL